MFQIVFTESYKKREIKFFKGHPELISQYEKTLKILEMDPFHNSLRLHKLNPPLEALPSVSINMQYRITLELLLKNGQIILVNVGTHEQVYR